MIRHLPIVQTDVHLTLSKQGLRIRCFICQFSCFLLFVFSFHAENLFSQGTWAPVSTLAPDLNGGGMLLLSDGTVLAKSFSGGSDGIGNIYDRLTPDIHGSYANGTWSTISAMIDTRLYYSSQVLMDGRVYVAGGEYGSGGTKAEVYDPLTDTWTATPNIYIYMSDANSEILPDGRVLQALVGAASSHATIIYDPVANNWNFGPTAYGSHNESSWVKLADSSILFVDIHSTNSERYIPLLNQWVQDATVPVALYDDYGFETGAALLLPDGRAFFIGATGHTAYYTPSGSGNPGTWEAGPDIPDAQGTPDAAAAMMVNGKILCAVSPVPSWAGVFQSPTSYYEFDYLTNTFTQIDGPNGTLTTDEPCYFTGMLDLPDGTVLYADQYSQQYYIYTPDGSPLEEGKPTIGGIYRVNCDTFMAVGTLFNGISEGAYYGDDWQMNTNYPVIRLTAGDEVYYARTFDWNSTGVQRGDQPDTTYFTVPSSLPDTIFSLVVTANGIASDPVDFAPFPLLSSTLTPPGICSNTIFSYAPASYDSTATFTWTRAAVSGISNEEVTDPQTTEPNEILIDTTENPVSVVYEFTITVDGCSNVQEVTVVVNPNASPVISGDLSICEGESATLAAEGGVSYEWNTGDTTASISVNPTMTTVYSVMATNSYGCTGESSQEVTVHPLPAVDFTGLPDTVCIFTEGVPLTGIPDGGTFTGDGMVGNVFSPSGLSEGYNTVTYSYSDAYGCTNTTSQDVYVSLCTGIASVSAATENQLLVYPNPAKTSVLVTSPVATIGNGVIRVVDLLGRTVMEENIKSSGNGFEHVLNLEGVAQGNYLITLQMAGGILKAKVVVE